MIRAAIIGCGKIADQHVQAIRRIPDTEVAAVCDREILMARQLGERFGIGHCSSDLAELLSANKPDVVHITTPPQSHYSLAKECLDGGCHVYLEKPFTVTAEEAVSLIEIARTRNLRITAGHNLQFTLEMLQMRRLIQEGFLGGPPVHIESYFPYSLEDTTYVGALLGSRNHWVRQLPGQLFHNVISHPVARLAEFLDDEITEVTATAHQSRRLASLGGQEVLDELRVLMRDRNDTTAFLCFSTSIKPGHSELRIFGPKNSIFVDYSSGSVIRRRSGSNKSYLTYVIPPIKAACEHIRNAYRNIKDIVSGRLHQDAGMKEIVEQFYQSIRTGGNPPIPYREIILTARIMEEIFEQVYSQAPAPDKVQPQLV